MKFHQKLNDQANSLKATAEMLSCLAVSLPPEASNEATTYRDAARLVGACAASVMRLASEAIVTE
jgi:hypothetical protein